MSIKIKKENSNIYKETENINKQPLSTSDSSPESTDRKLHNQIQSKVAQYLKEKRTMNDSLFKVTLETIYYDIFKKNLTYRNIPDDISLQINIKKIMDDYSYVKGYNILKYYMHKNKIMPDESLLSVTALFYATLKNFIKRMDTK